ncbi:MAG: nitrile hydratase accessory protein [Candidatus Binataceae bacterium]
MAVRTFAQKTLAQLIEGRELDARLVFHEPWEARAFALVLTMVEGGRFSWEEFRQRLIAEVARADTVDAAHPDASTAVYYECWLRALEELLRTKAILDATEIERRADAIAASPPAPTRPAFAGFIKAG